MEQFKRVQVILLPIPDTHQIKNTICINRGNMYISKELSSSKHETYHYLYFLSDNEIEEGDWYYNERLNQVFQAIRKSGYNTVDKEYKIIATTDTNLILDTFDKKTCKGNKDCARYCDCLTLKQKGLSQPSQQFIEKYVEAYNTGKPITKVLVEYDTMWIANHNNGYHKQTLKVNPKDNTITIRRLKESWNRDEVIELLGNMRTADIKAGSLFSLEQWIKENL